MAFVSNGSAGSYVTRTSGLPSSTGTFTLYFTFKMTSDRDAESALVQVATSGETDLHIAATGGSGTDLYGYGNYGATSVSLLTLTTGVWYYAAIIGNGTDLKFYVSDDGDDWASVVGTVTQTTFTIGDVKILDDGRSEPLDGKLAHIRMWDAVLNTTELAAEADSSAAVRTSNLVSDHRGVAADLATALAGETGSAFSSVGTISLDTDEPVTSGGGGGLPVVPTDYVATLNNAVATFGNAGASVLNQLDYFDAVADALADAVGDLNTRMGVVDSGTSSAVTTLVAECATYASAPRTVFNHLALVLDIVSSTDDAMVALETRIDAQDSLGTMTEIDDVESACSAYTGTARSMFNHVVEMRTFVSKLGLAVTEMDARLADIESGSASPTPSSRDLTLWPFDKYGQWNLPIGGNALYASGSNPIVAGTIRNLNPGFNINSSQWSIPVFYAQDSDPTHTINVFASGFTGGQVQIKAPANLAPSPDGNGNDRPMVVIDPTETYAHEFWNVSAAGTYTWSCVSYQRVPLTHAGTGTVTGFGPANYYTMPGYQLGWGGTRAYGGSNLAGLIRTNELVNGIPHSLCVAAPRELMTSPWVWPATRDDYYTSYPNNGAANLVYCGMLLAVPPSVNLAGLGLSTRVLNIMTALQDYGGIIVDMSDTWCLYMEQNHASEANAVNMTELRNAWAAYVTFITNNTEVTPKGGGTLRAALAP